VAEATEAVQDVKRLLETLLDARTVAALKRSTEGLADLTTTVVDEKQRVESLIDDVEAVSRDIRPLVQSLKDEKTIASLKSSIDGLAAHPSTLAANTRHLEAILVNADQDSREIRPLIASTRATVQQLQTQVLPQFDHAVGNLNALSRKMNGLADDLSRHP